MGCACRFGLDSRKQAAEEPPHTDAVDGLATVPGRILVVDRRGAAGSGEGDVGEVVAVGGAVPVLFTGWDERGVSLGYSDLFGLARDVAFSTDYEEDLVGGVGVELVLGPP